MLYYGMDTRQVFTPSNVFWQLHWDSSLDIMTTHGLPLLVLRSIDNS